MRVCVGGGGGGGGGGLPRLWGDGEGRQAWQGSGTAAQASVATLCCQPSNPSNLYGSKQPWTRHATPTPLPPKVDAPAAPRTSHPYLPPKVDALAVLAGPVCGVAPAAAAAALAVAPAHPAGILKAQAVLAEEGLLAPVGLHEGGRRL